ncbi:MAG: DNA-protecting protein DprA [Micavibrio sp.]|nr:DNA-protecting protein DprA [Micavibrio sp.]|tara:strand:- start:32727 stop:33854 length:1128 start_codon:yes stop_codon:yes gene_type:complete
MSVSDTPLTENERLDWLRLSGTSGIGPITFHKLLARYKTIERALEALPELQKKGGGKAHSKIMSREAAAKEFHALEKRGGKIICACEETYPLVLSAIDDAPPVLRTVGNIDLLAKPTMGIVGARNASLNGRKLTHKLARDLGEAGQIVASGLARGIDTAAHEGSLATGTIAVVAGGVDVIYPKENEGLYAQILEQGGLILAENALGTKPTAQHFPRRNRIVSGLSAGIVVVEATVRSGSLITARLAAEQGRDVFAVPGFPSDPRASGPNKLLKDGATLVENAQDILSQISQFEPKAVPNGLFEENHGLDWTKASAEPDNSEREKITSLLSHQPVSVDEIVRTCHVNISGVQTVLLELELAGRLSRLPGNRVSLIE